MYKVFINNKRLILANAKEKINYRDAVVVCLKKPETVNVAIRNHLLKSSTSDFIILSADEKKLIETFESNYEVRIAAGGWVWNDKDELLMIYREKHWDIPKGHLDEGETIEECAKREVCEETNICNLQLENQIGVSRHIYEYKGKMVLKITHWYQMKTDSTEILKPQLNEGITDVKWIPKKRLQVYLEQSWTSLQEFYKEHITY